jgi:hypothetical protein
MSSSSLNSAIVFAPFENKTCDMAPRTFALGSVLGRKPAHVAEISDLRASAHEHQQPFIDRIDQDYALTLGVLLDRFPHPRRRAFLAALVHDGSEGRVDVVRRSPLTGEAVKALGQRVRAGIEVERELGIQRRVKVRRRDPIMLTVVPVADMELVVGRIQLRLMRAVKKLFHEGVSILVNNPGRGRRAPRFFVRPKAD